MALAIRIDQARPAGGSSVGVAGQAREDGWQNQQVTLTAVGASGTVNWQLLHSPAGSTATLSSSTGTSVTFTPNVAGYTYRLRGFDSSSSQILVLRIRFDAAGNLVDGGLCQPAPGERAAEANFGGTNADGWDQANLRYDAEAKAKRKQINAPVTTPTDLAAVAAPDRAVGQLRATTSPPGVWEHVASLPATADGVNYLASSDASGTGWVSDSGRFAQALVSAGAGVLRSDGAGHITAGQVANADVATNAAIATSKLGQSGAATGQALVWNGTSWSPSTNFGAQAFTTTGPLTAGSATITSLGQGVVHSSSGGVLSSSLVVDADVANVAPSKLTQASAATGQALIWNGSAWSPSTNFGAQVLTTTGAFAHGGNPATTGAVRLSNGDAIVARGVAVVADVPLIGLDADNVINLGGNTTTDMGHTGFIRVNALVVAMSATKTTGTAFYTVETPATGTAGRPVMLLGQVMVTAGSAGGDAIVASGFGVVGAGSVRLVVNEDGTGAGTTRLLVNPNGTLQASAYGTGVSHFDGSGNITSSLIVNADVSSTAAITTGKLAQGAAQLGQALIWNGSAWAPGTNFFAQNLNTTGSVSIGSTLASPPADALLLTRAASTDVTRIAMIDGTSSAAWRFGMSSSGTNELRIWRSASGFDESADTKYSFGSGGLGVYPSGVTQTGFGIFPNSSGAVALQIVNVSTGTGAPVRIMGQTSTGSTGGDIWLDSGNGAAGATGSIRMRMGTSSPAEIWRFQKNQLFTSQASLYAMGVTPSTSNWTLSSDGQFTTLNGTTDVNLAVGGTPIISAITGAVGSSFGYALDGAAFPLGGSFALYQQTRLTDAATHDMLIQSQAPFSGASGTNRNPGNMVYAVPSPATGGTAGKHSFKVSGSELFAMQQFPGVPSFATMYAAGVAASSTNYIFTADGNVLTNINVPSSSGQVSLSAGGQAIVIAENGTLSFFGPLANPVLTHEPRTTDVPTSTMTIRSQAPAAGATGTNRNPGNLSYEVPAPASGGTAGTHTFVISNTQAFRVDTLGVSVGAATAVPTTGILRLPGNSKITWKDGDGGDYVGLQLVTQAGESLLALGDSSRMTTYPSALLIYNTQGLVAFGKEIRTSTQFGSFPVFGIQSDTVATGTGLAAALVGQQLTQAGTTGGDVVVSSGKGASTDGAVLLQTGYNWNAATAGTTRARFRPDGTVQFTGYGVGIAHFDASGNFSSSLLVNADVSSSAAIAPSKVGQAGASTGQALIWNGSAWAPASVSSGSIAPNSITGAQLMRGGTNEVLWSANSSTDAAFTGAPTLSTSLAIGTNPAQTGPLRLPYDQGIFARNLANNGDLPIIRRGTVSINNGGFTETNAVVIGDSTGDGDVVVDGINAATGFFILKKGGMLFDSTAKGAIRGAGFAVTLSSFATTINNATGTAIRLLGQIATGSSSTGGDAVVASGHGTLADGSVLLVTGDPGNNTGVGNVQLTIKPTGVVQLNAYSTGIAHIDASGNITSSLVVDADVANVAPSKLTQASATTGQALIWNGSAWSPGTDFGAQTVVVANLRATSMGAGVVHANGSGNLTSSPVVDADVSSSAAIATSKLGQGGAGTGQALIWNGSAWSPSTNFGSQSLSTTGTVTAGTLVATSSATVGNLTVSSLGIGVVHGNSSGVLTSSSVVDADIATVAPSKITQVGAATGQALIWNGSAWAPSTNFGAQNLVTSGGFTVANGRFTSMGTGIVHSDALGQVSSSLIVNADVAANAAIAASKLGQSGAVVGQALIWNGSAWAPGTDFSTQSLSTTGNVVLRNDSGTLGPSRVPGAVSGQLVQWVQQEVQPTNSLASTLFVRDDLGAISSLAPHTVETTGSVDLLFGARGSRQITFSTPGTYDLFAFSMPPAPVSLSSSTWFDAVFDVLLFPTDGTETYPGRLTMAAVGHYDGAVTFTVTRLDPSTTTLLGGSVPGTIFLDRSGPVLIMRWTLGSLAGLAPTYRAAVRGTLWLKD